VSTVVVADGDRHTRTGLCLILEEAGFSVLAEVEDAYAAVEASLRTRPSLCLIAVELPGAVEVIATMRVELPGTRLVVLSVIYDEDEVFRCVKAGASGYLLKDAPSSRLPDALQAVLRGEPALPRVVVGRLIDEVIDLGRRAAESVQTRPQDGLTRRQRQVLQLMREGLTTGEIARRLSLSDVTVRRHLSDVVRRTGAANRDALRE
jgi:DNA-binding NarL/FixJ family response regulator